MKKYTLLTSSLLALLLSGCGSNSSNVQQKLDIRQLSTEAKEVAEAVDQAQNFLDSSELGLAFSSAKEFLPKDTSLKGLKAWADNGDMGAFISTINMQVDPMQKAMLQKVLDATKKELSDASQITIALGQNDASLKAFLILAPQDSGINKTSNLDALREMIQTQSAVDGSSLRKFDLDAVVSDIAARFFLTGDNNRLILKTMILDPSLDNTEWRALFKKDQIQAPQIQALAQSLAIDIVSCREARLSKGLDTSFLEGGECKVFPLSGYCALSGSKGQMKGIFSQSFGSTVVGGNFTYSNSTLQQGSAFVSHSLGSLFLQGTAVMKEIGSYASFTCGLDFTKVSPFVEFNSDGTRFIGVDFGKSTFEVGNVSLGSLFATKVGESGLTLAWNGTMNLLSGVNVNTDVTTSSASLSFVVSR